jgi:hypothetical protein
MQVCLMSSSAEQSSSPDADPAATTCFSVTGEASPGLMPRLLEPFAKRGLVPDAFHARTIDGRLIVEIRCHGMEAALAGYIGRCLRQIYLVERVLVSTDAAEYGA